jgi:hypothetical protein
MSWCLTLKSQAMMKIIENNHKGNIKLTSSWFKRGLSILYSAIFLLIAQQALAETVEVSNIQQLASEISAANQRGGDTIIHLSDGLYALTSSLYITAPNITLMGNSLDRTKVIIEGDAMSSNAKVGSLIDVSSTGFTLENVTLQKCRYHLIQIHGELNADQPVLKNCIFRDSYEQMIKVSVDLNNTSVAADDGLVENCLFEYSAGSGPQYYIGGIDAHSAKNWVVRNNVFKHIISPSGSVAEYAIHFWNNSANNLVEKNLIIDCDRGIGFGMEGRGNSGGTIRNNMIYHSRNNGQYADVGISLADSPNSQVVNNTIFQEHNFPWAIEYRFSSTKNVYIVNNLTNRQIASRDGGTATLTKNVTSAVSTWFINPQAGDLHLADTNNSSVIDNGVHVTGVLDDFDGDSRSLGDGIDVGADEIVSKTEPSISAPKNLRIID